MKHTTYKLVMLLLVGVIFGSCNTLRYLNEEDPDVIYDRALELYGEERWSKASRNFEKVMQNYMGTPREDSIIFYNSRCKFKDGDYYTAISYFNSYRMQFSRSPFLEDAEGMLTLSYYYISPGPERDPANIHQALSSIDEFHSRYPQSENYDMFTEIKEELIQRLHDRAYLSAYTYYKTGHYKAAIVALRNALKEYPTSTNRENIMYYMVVSAYELARNSIPSLEVDRYMATIDMYYTFVAEFPTSEYVKDLNRIHDNAKAFLEKRNTDLVEGESIL